MKNRRLGCFYTDKIRPYLPDSEVRKIAHKKYKQWVSDRLSREDQEETPLCGIHVFVGLPHIQNNGAVRGKLRHELKSESEEKSTSLFNRWQKVKAEIAERFAREGNAQFINEVKKVEKSRKKKHSVAVKAKKSNTKPKLICASEV